jgi:hypothetical protein
MSNQLEAKPSNNPSSSKQAQAWNPRDRAINQSWTNQTYKASQTRAGQTNKATIQAARQAGQFASLWGEQQQTTAVARETLAAGSCGSCTRAGGRSTHTTIKHSKQAHDKRTLNASTQQSNTIQASGASAGSKQHSNFAGKRAGG